MNLTLCGLLLNGIGGLILLFCPPTIPEITEDGRIKYARTSVGTLRTSTADKWRSLVRRYGYYVGLVALTFGFVLQLIAEFADR